MRICDGMWGVINDFFLLIELLKPFELWEETV
jgi:hypothetical protein